jgi:PBP1b-binding outer membrane lipoprotein LpoB
VTGRAALPARRAVRRRASGSVRSLAAAVAAVVLVGCASKEAPPPQATEPEAIATAEAVPPSTKLVAVLPIEPAPAPAHDGHPPAPAPPPDAGLAVTAQIYRALADQTEFRFVPDLTVSDELEVPQVRSAGDLLSRAIALGKDVGADAVVFGRVFRFEQRVGTEYGATQPASVWFELAVVDVARGEVVWHDSFDQTQQPLTSNLLNWWMFWRSGPRWVSAGELAGLGVDRMFGHLTAAVEGDG